MNVHELLRSQDGLITRRQATEAGLTRALIARRLARGDWTRVRPSVFLSAAHPMTPRAQVRADVLWLGDGATLTGAAAAWWWRLTDDPPAVVRVAVPPTSRVRGRPGTVPERRALEAGERVVVDGLTVTPRALTVVDAVRALGVARGAELVDRALLQGRVGIADLRAAHRRTLGRRGSGSMAALLPLAAGGARFAAEQRLHRVLRNHGLTGWTADHPIWLPGHGRVVLDLAFTDVKVAVEVDGWAYHRDLDAFRRDRRRQNALVLAGWMVLRVTWHDLVADPERVLAEIEAALSDRQFGSLRPAG